jgi:hypothetical protein
VVILGRPEIVQDREKRRMINAAAKVVREKRSFGPFTPLTSPEGSSL